MSNKRIVVALTGASGAVYGIRLLQLLARTGLDIHFTLSDAAASVISHELSRRVDLDDEEGVLATLIGSERASFTYHHYRDLTAPIASGSFLTRGMVIIPCSMGTLGRIAGGISQSLVDRAADVCLKERRTLILVPRETPYSEIHLENMLRVTRAGAVVLPASPGFYAMHASVDQLIDFVVARVLDHLGIASDLVPRYGEPVSRFVEE